MSAAMKTDDHVFLSSLFTFICAVKAFVLFFPPAVIEYLMNQVLIAHLLKRASYLNHLH